MTATLSNGLASLNLTQPPVAVAFLSAPPPDLKRVDHAAAAGCGYWKYASDGHSFYTTAEDHHNCPVGAFTHGAVLPPARAQELESLVGTMIELQYLQRDEVPRIAHRSEPLQIAAYAPLAEATFPPDVIIFRGNARQIMLLSEAARAAGVFEAGTAMGRPACAMIPHALETGASVASVGCIGNRVYTGLGDNELYLAVPANAIERTMDKLAIVVNANEELETFHRQRAATLGA